MSLTSLSTSNDPSTLDGFLYPVDTEGVYWTANGWEQNDGNPPYAAEPTSAPGPTTARVVLGGYLITISGYPFATATATPNIAPGSVELSGYIGDFSSIPPPFHSEVLWTSWRSTTARL
jgi:hypothetical protein